MSLPFNPTEAQVPLHGHPVLHPGHRRHSNDNPRGSTLPGCFWVTQSLHFGFLGTGSEARWLEGGSIFPAESLPRSLARQQQVPKTEPTSAACFGGGRHGVGPSPAAEKPRHLGHFGLPPAKVEGASPANSGLPRRAGAVTALSDASEPHPEGTGARPIWGQEQFGVKWVRCSQQRGRGGCQHLLPLSPHPARCRDTEVLCEALAARQSCWRPGTGAQTLQ